MTDETTTLEHASNDNDDENDPTTTTSSSAPHRDPQQDYERPAPTSRRNVTQRSGNDLLADLASNLEIPENLNDAEAAAARFDVSPYRLWLLFQSVDENRDGYITKQELAHALTSASSTNHNNQSQNIGAIHIVDKKTPSGVSIVDKKEEIKDKRQVDDGQGEDENHIHDDDDDSSSGVETMPLQDIKALDELFDRVVCNDQDGGVAQPLSKLGNSERSIDDDDQTEEQNNQCLPSSNNVGISFPQFCRIMRYLWLQQLLNTHLDNLRDTENEYSFECVDYSSGYYRQKKITGNVSEKRTRDFFTAPRHGHARMRWIDVPSGTFSKSSLKKKFDSLQRNQKDSFRITILRLAVKYRFHPTSIEDAIDLEYQEPKVNSFEHSLLDLGNFHCGTISWLKNAGIWNVAQDTPIVQQMGDWDLDMSPNKAITLPPPSIPKPAPHARATSGGTFNTYHKEAAMQGRISNVPDFVIAEGEDGISMNEGRHYFITIPMFELSRRSQTSLDLYKETSDLIHPMQVQPLIIEVIEATVGIFVASQPDANLVVTCSTKWRPTRIKPFKEYLRGNNANTKRTSRGTSASRRRKRMSRDRPDGTGSFDDWDDASDNDDYSVDFGDEDKANGDGDESEVDRLMQAMLQDEKRALERVKGLLKKRHSIQRHRNSNWLMHAIIDAVVDNLVPISKIYEAQLQRLSTRIFELQHRLSREEVKEIIVMKRDLEWLQRELRPFGRVIRHLIDDRNIGIEVTHYLEDIEDHLLRTLEELSSFASECVSLKDEYNAYLDRRMNDILYVLTVVTTLVVPGQFLTGYYGMNCKLHHWSVTWLFCMCTVPVREKEIPSV